MTYIIILINSFIQNLIKIVFRTLSVSLAKVEVEGSNPFARPKNCGFFTSKVLGIKQGIKFFG